MKALEKSNYMDFCQTIDLFLNKVEIHNKNVKANELKDKLKS